VPISNKADKKVEKTPTQIILRFAGHVAVLARRIAGGATASNIILSP